MFKHTKPRYTIKDAAFLLGVSIAEIHNRVSSGDLVSYKVGRRRYFSPEAIDQIVHLDRFGTIEPGGIELERLRIGIPQPPRFSLSEDPIEEIS